MSNFQKFYCFRQIHLTKNLPRAMKIRVANFAINHIRIIASHGFLRTAIVTK